VTRTFYFLEQCCERANTQNVLFRHRASSAVRVGAPSPYLCRKWVIKIKIRGDFGDSETAMSSELIRWTQFSPSVRTRPSPAFARRFRPRNWARPCKRDSSCDCRARRSPIPALFCVLMRVTRALRSATRTKTQTAVARDPKRIVFTNFLTLRAENLAGTFFHFSTWSRPPYILVWHPNSEAVCLALESLLLHPLFVVSHSNLKLKGRNVRLTRFECKTQI